MNYKTKGILYALLFGLAILALSWLLSSCAATKSKHTVKSSTDSLAVKKAAEAQVSTTKASTTTKIDSQSKALSELHLYFRPETLEAVSVNGSATDYGDNALEISGNYSVTRPSKNIPVNQKKIFHYRINGNIIEAEAPLDSVKLTNSQSGSKTVSVDQMFDKMDSSASSSSDSTHVAKNTVVKEKQKKGISPLMWTLAGIGVVSIIIAVVKLRKRASSMKFIDKE